MREIKFRAWDKHYKRFRDIVLSSPISALNNNEIDSMQQVLLDKHFNRKHGPGAYYGQAK